jgi:hypothetical protein
MERLTDKDFDVNSVYINPNASEKKEIQYSEAEMERIRESSQKSLQAYNNVMNLLYHYLLLDKKETV